ncbi:Putative DNA-binding domain-containing protein [Cribrihabitans marinus]|uniref:Putative DNA-binding domain-containing protein n=1 Tax=Cribrihabitans marinus TaxID=1227549 RepID=A0A1H6TCI1_9RHOB|nr:DNA-binding domain-containing protein [Cribrihabitans marinus]GGH22394.1 DUF2063 domain-containing protein [Cribrihabitans marinus]SEI74797.1 Putative DNA-binding domain-containing protein [Cribrihabitans marinus]
MSVTQDEFRDALLNPSQAVPGGLSDGAARPAGRRFNVYRNNVAVSLTEAMKEAFPVITRMLGTANMEGLAGLYLRAHPPSSPLMMHYGEHFPELLARTEQLSHLGYLPDVARLELALRRSYHAADAAPIDPQALALDPDRLLALRPTLAPAAQLVRSRWPIHALWLYNTRDGAPKPEPGAQDVLILRPEFDPEPHLLPPGGAALVQALQGGRTLGEAFYAATQEDPEHDLGASLTLLLAGGAITSFDAKR